MTLRTLLKYLIVIYVFIVVSVQTILFGLDRLVDRNLGKVNQASDKLLHTLDRAEALGLLFVLGSLQNEEVLPVLKLEFSRLGLDEYASIVEEMENK